MSVGRIETRPTGSIESVIILLLLKHKADLSNAVA